ncbi:MAG TPA: YqhA family protein [Tepidisphaeraceae bacterium]|nr:YqhA family protein [Tepidisphaeraceae bacterium]
MLKRILEKVPALMILAVCACLASAVAAMLLGILRTIKLFMLLRGALQTGSLAIAVLVEIADIYLIAATLIIVGLSLCELFVTELHLPAWLVIKSFDQLKSKLFNLIALVAGVSFLKLLLDSAETALDTLYYGVACAAVIAALGVFARLSGDHPDSG